MVCFCGCCGFVFGSLVGVVIWCVVVLDGLLVFSGCGCYSNCLVTVGWVGWWIDDVVVIWLVYVICELLFI